MLQRSKNKQQSVIQRPALTNAGLPADSPHYGPIFPCICCNGLQFLSSVVELGKVEALRSPEARDRFLDVQNVLANPALFLQLDRHWVCRRCQETMARNTMPPLAAKNGLPATWSLLPAYMRRLSLPELEMVHLGRVSRYCKSVSGI